MRKLISKCLLVFVAVATVSVAEAADPAAPFDVATVVAQQQKIRLDAQSGDGGFSELPAQTRSQLLERQKALLGLIEGRSYEQLDEQQRLQATQEIAWIDGIAKQAADERLVCERTKAIGSNRTERVCKSARQRREERETARDAMQNGNRGIDNLDLGAQ